MTPARQNPARRFNADVAFYILSHIPVRPSHEALWLWTSARHVSRDFRDAVERIWVQKQLPKTYLHIEPGRAHNCNFVFSHVAPTDRSVAVFIEQDISHARRKDASAMLKSYMRKGNPPHNPKVTVVIRRDVNDTWVPGLQADWDKMEITCDWKGLVSEFMREKSEEARRQRLLMIPLNLQMEAVRDKFASENEELPYQIVLEAWAGHMIRMEKELYATSRQPGQMDDDGEDDDNDNDSSDDDDDVLISSSAETRALKKLKDHRMALDLVEFSDEEDENEDTVEEGSKEEGGDQREDQGSREGDDDEDDDESE